MELNSVQKLSTEDLEVEKMSSNWNQRVQILEEPGSNPYLENPRINF
jgi:hypothetical protein